MYAPLNLSVGVHYRPHEPDSLIALVKTETEVITFVQPLSPGNKDLGEVTIYLPIFGLIKVSNSGLGNELQPRMIKLGRERGKCSLNVAQTDPACKLGKAHDHKLVSTGEVNGMEVAIVFVNTFLKLMLWQKRHQLRENGFSDGHSMSKLDKYYIQ